MGIIGNAMKVKPNCRYGHGDLKKVHFLNRSDSPRLLLLPTATQILPEAPLSFDSAGFTVALYRCPECGYVELFDDEVENG